MARNWSEAVKLCPKPGHHKRQVTTDPTTGKDKARWCRCQDGVQWRYRMGEPDPVTGQIGRPRWSPRFPSKELADKDQLRRRKEIAEGEYRTDGGRTVGQWLDEWLDRRTLNSEGAVTTEAGYRAICENWLKPALGHHRLGTLSADNVQATMNQIAKGRSLRRDGKAPSPGTLVNIRAVLRSALSDAVHLRLISHNPAALVKLPKVTRRKRDPLTREQLRAFLRHVADDDMLAPVFVLAAFTGARRGELCGLRWPCVDLALGVIRIRKQIAGPSGRHDCELCGGSHTGRLYKDVKSEKSRRDIPLHPSLVAMLTEQQARVATMAAHWPGEWSDHQLVFPHPGGSGEAPGVPLRPDYLGHRFTVLLKSSGIDTDPATRPTLHTLRSGLLTLVVEGGASAELAAQIAGHADPSVTRDWYLRASAEVTRAALSAVLTTVTDGSSDPLTDPAGHDLASREEAALAF